jgi:hypothetical protein
MDAAAASAPSRATLSTLLQTPGPIRSQCRKPGYIRGERCIQGQVISCMIANDIRNGSVGAFRIVQVRHAVGEPAAAPVTTPSNRPNRGRMPGILSITATNCISDVPVLAKQTSTPLSIRVCNRASAPFISLTVSTPLCLHYGAPGIRQRKYRNCHIGDT